MFLDKFIRRNSNVSGQWHATCGNAATAPAADGTAAARNRLTVNGFAKRPVSQHETGRFGTQNGPNGNAKRPPPQSPHKAAYGRGAPNSHAAAATRACRQQAGDKV